MGDMFKQPSTMAAIAAMISGIPEFAPWVAPVKYILLGVFGLAGVVMKEKGTGQ